MSHNGRYVVLPEKGNINPNRTITGKFIEKITDYTLTLTWVEQYSGGQGFSSWNYFVRVAVNPSANVSVIVNGKDDNTRVGFPLTIKMMETNTTIMKLMRIVIMKEMSYTTPAVRFLISQLLSMMYVLYQTSQ